MGSTPNIVFPYSAQKNISLKELLPIYQERQEEWCLLGMQELGIFNDIEAVPLYFSEVNLGACIP
jgi:hypothetical protein